jgi:single-strand DNA-binding protein
MASVNKAIIIGRVGKEPEIKNFQNGGAIANFSMATTESWKDKATGEKKERTDWHNISCSNPALVSVIEKYVHKGDMLYIEGKNRTRSWEKEGKTTYITEIIVDSIVLIQGKRGDSQQEGGSSFESSAAGGSQQFEDSLPF